MHIPIYQLKCCKRWIRIKLTCLKAQRIYTSAITLFSYTNALAYSKIQLSQYNRERPNVFCNIE